MLKIDNKQFLTIISIILSVVVVFIGISFYRSFSFNNDLIAKDSTKKEKIKIFADTIAIVSMKEEIKNKIKFLKDISNNLNKRIDSLNLNKTSLEFEKEVKQLNQLILELSINYGELKVMLLNKEKDNL